MTEISTERSMETIGAEIRTLTEQARYMTVWFACEIGRRLTEAKEALPHGEFGQWLEENTEFSSSSAQRFMTAFREYAPYIKGENPKCPTLGKMSISNALRLLAVPEEEREEFAIENDLEHKSAREVDELIKARDEANKRAEAAERAAREAEEGSALAIAEKEEKYCAQIDKLRARAEKAEADAEEAMDNLGDLEKARDSAEKELEELKSRPIDVAVERDEEAIKQAADEARAEAEKAWAEKVAGIQAQLEGVQKKRDKLEQAVKEAETKLADAGSEDKAEKERLAGEVEQLRKQLALSDANVAVFNVHFKAWQNEFRELEALLVGENSERLKAAMKAVVGGWAGKLGGE